MFSFGSPSKAAIQKRAKELEEELQAAKDTIERQKEEHTINEKTLLIRLENLLKLQLEYKQSVAHKNEEMKNVTRINETLRAGAEAVELMNRTQMKELGDLRSKVNELTPEVAVLRQEKTQSEETIKNLRQELESVREKYQKDTAAHIEEVRNLKQTHQQSIGLYERRVLEEKKAAENMKRDFDFYSSENQNMKGILESVEESLEQTEAKLKTLTKAHKSVTEERDNLSLQLRACQMQMAELNRTVGDIKQKELWQSLEAELNGKENAKETQAQLEELERLKETHQQSIMLYERRIIEDKRAMETLQRDHDFYASENQNLKGLLESVQDSLEQTEAKLKTLSKTHKTVAEERDNLSLQLRACQMQMAELSKTVGDIKQKELWQSLEAELTAKEKAREEDEKKAMLEELKLKTNEISNLSFKLYTLTTTINELTRDRDYYQSEHKNVAAILESIEESYEASEKKVHSLERVNKHITEERDSLSLQLRALQRQMAELNKEVADAKQKEIWRMLEDEMNAKTKVDAGPEANAVDAQNEYEPLISALKEQLQAAHETFAKTKEELEGRIEALEHELAERKDEKVTLMSKFPEGYTFDKISEEHERLSAALEKATAKLEATEKKLFVVDREGKQRKADLLNILTKKSNRVDVEVSNDDDKGGSPK